MQRLLGTFPNRSAGFALLILRLAVAGALISSARLCPGPETDVLLALSRIAAVLIIIGWYTPVAATSAVVVTLCTLWVCRGTGIDVLRINALMIAILVAIGLLGAGAYSVDARLYGRRRLVVGRPRGKLEGRQTP
jgi:hypothetical protein